MEDLFKKYSEEAANLRRKGYSDKQILNYLQFQEERMRGIQKDYRCKKSTKGGQKQGDNSRSDGR